MTLEAVDEKAAEELARSGGLEATSTAPDEQVGTSSQAELPKYRHLDVEGEGSHQEALEAFAGGRTAGPRNVVVDAELIATPVGTKPAKVPVAIQGHVVERLASAHATQLRKGMKVLGKCVERTPCKAKITGGWRRGSDDQGMFGVIVMLPAA